MLGGGPASQHPQSQSQQIRGLLPRVVTPVSLRYPQMLWFSGGFFAGAMRFRAKFLGRDVRMPVRVNNIRTRPAGRASADHCNFHQFKTTARICLPR
jgi:hypothetical protein